MRIRDWSSDVCSSDLARSRRRDRPGVRAGPAELFHQPERAARPLGAGAGAPAARRDGRVNRRTGRRNGPESKLRRRPVHAGRSEEHTSELQSLMRISYAVFCLKKKKQKTPTTEDI